MGRLLQVRKEFLQKGALVVKYGTHFSMRKAYCFMFVDLVVGARKSVAS